MSDPTSTNTSATATAAAAAADNALPGTVVVREKWECGVWGGGGVGAWGGWWVGGEKVVFKGCATKRVLRDGI